jgi:hypothetical protein
MKHIKHIKFLNEDLFDYKVKNIIKDKKERFGFYQQLFYLLDPNLRLNFEEFRNLMVDFVSIEDQIKEAFF